MTGQLRTTLDDQSLPSGGSTAGTAPSTVAGAAQEPTGWRATLWAMVAVQFVMSAAITGMSPVLPLFLPQIGVHDRSTVEMWAGVLNATTSFVAAIASPFWGQLADRYGRKVMVLRSGIAICIFTGLMSLSQNVWQLFGIRIMMGAFSGFSATAIALVASQVPEWRLGASLGWLSTGQLTGSLLGPLIGGGVADLMGNYRMSFAATSVLAGISMLLALSTVRERRVTAKPARTTRAKPGLLTNFRVVVAANGILPLLMVLLLAQFGTRTVQPVISLYVKELVGSAPNLATLAGFAFSMTGFADLIASPFLGKRSDVLGYRRVLLICLAGAAIGTAPQALAVNYWMFVALRFAVGMFVGGILPTANALIGRSVAADKRGLVYGMTASATFLGSSLGPLTGGTIASLFGIPVVFLVTGSIMALNWVWVFFAVPELKGRQD
ncbi:MAG: MFS transporter [Acetobacteraceae bacterium]|nr:MFS transporter [Acetobacteraceae bacterium]